jgi:NADH-quinone oxidoreductase subunit N
MMALFGLAGIPPTIGFAGKLFIFVAAMQQGYLVLVLVAMANVVISLYYYLLVLKAAYLDEPARAPEPIDMKLSGRVMAMVMIAMIVGIGFYPTALFDLVQAAVSRLP